MSKQTTACFTGHRPEKISASGNPSNSYLSQIKSMLYLEILEAVRDRGYNTFISGMARGVDMWACNIVLSLKKQYPDIKLICAMPYRNFGNSWSGVDRFELNRYLSHADEIIYVSESYSKDCFKLRNYYMVDHSSLLIGICRDDKSGTGQTIRYAKSQGLDTHIINLPDESFFDSYE